MSALGQKQTFRDVLSHVCFTPESGHSAERAVCPLRANSGHLFDYFIRTSNEWRWNNEPKCLRSLEIDDQLDFARLLDWQLGGLLTLEDAAGVDTDLPKWLRRTSSVTQQAARRRECTILVNRWHRIAD